MNCGICSTSSRTHGEATCASCARALIYQARLDHLTDLLARESLKESVSKIVTPSSQAEVAAPSRGPESIDIIESAAKHNYALLVGETQALEARCGSVHQQAQQLKRQIEDARTDVATRTADHDRRRAELSSERQLLKTRGTQLLEPLKANIKYLGDKIGKNQSRTRLGRVKLCNETARLAGLQPRRRKTFDGRIVEDYMIGGVPIPDLRNLHNARPDQVTAALANICRLLTMTCHYLSVRLPAEINPPHANYPHPTMLSIQSSYQGFDIPFPGAPNSTAASHTASASHLLEHHRSLPKLRLLHLDRPLKLLVREDMVSYNRFVEGVTLLAWDVAWLCRSQGLSTINSLSELCDLGKNLYTLFREHAIAQGGPNLPDAKGEAPVPPVFGQLSHAATHTNIEGHDGVEWMSRWDLLPWHRLTDKLKSHLNAEMSGAEWEMIAESEWDVEREDEQAVLVGGRRPAEQDTDQQSVTADKGKSQSGWTKLKSRADAA